MRNVRRIVLASSTAVAVVGGAASAFAASQAPPQLVGHGQGGWSVKPNNIPDVGTQETVRGHGHFSIGDATIGGVVAVPGFVVQGSCNVSARLVTDSGAIRIVGHSKVESRSGGAICAGREFRFRFHTTGATGDLAGSSYQGVGRFDLQDAAGGAADHGNFTLRLSRLG
jgi:hypothetical protein